MIVTAETGALFFVHVFVTVTTETGALFVVYACVTVTAETEALFVVHACMTMTVETGALIIVHVCVTVTAETGALLKNRYAYKSEILPTHIKKGIKYIKYKCYHLRYTTSSRVLRFQIR